MSAQLLQTVPVEGRNLLGQRLGRKGRDTRERILTATHALLKREPEGQISLSAVAREASIGMTTLYLYFADLGELIMAALQPVIDDMSSFTRHLDERWPDDRIEECAFRFIDAHFRYWSRHTRILHLRNSFADANDLRFLKRRMEITNPVIAALARQMDGGSGPFKMQSLATAIVLLSSIERMATVTTATNLEYLRQEASLNTNFASIPETLTAHSRLVALAIADQRATNNAPAFAQETDHERRP